MVDIQKVELPKEVIEDIVKNQPAYDSRVNNLFLTDGEFEKLKDPSFNLEKYRLEKKHNLKGIYNNIIETLKEYCDIKEEYYNIITLWIMGTYFHNNFPTYPYLFLNAMKGSGKSRLMNLIITLSKNGAMLNSLTEAVLFRTKGTLGIDEFEGAERKGKEELRELLNSSYKKGVKVKRMKKVRGEKGEEQVPEEFEVYRPIVMANINGMESVLEDRCITLILEKSDNKAITSLVEIFKYDLKVLSVPQEMEVILKNDQCSLCSVVSLLGTYQQWNTYIKYNYTNYTNNTNNTNNTFPFEIIKNTQISGRDLELCLPLFLIANEISGELLKETTLTLQEMVVAKKEEQFAENWDVALIDFVSQLLEADYYKTINQITNDFKSFLSSSNEHLNSWWIGRSLKRLNLIKQKRRTSRGVEVILDVVKAQEKIKMFK